MKKITLLLFAMVAFTWQSNAQFTESFDTEIPATWTVTDVDGGNTWVYNTTDSHSGAGHARITYNSNAHDDYLITPQFTVTADVSDRISFWSGISSNWAETFEVRLSTTGLAPADFTVVLGDEAPLTNVPTYTQYTYDLSAYDGMQVYIAIRATAADKFYLHIDEFVNDTPPTCPAPTAVTAGPTSITDADISWTAGASESAWNYEYGTAGFVQGAGTTGTTAAATLSLSALAGGDYDIYIQADCGAGDLSAWVGPISWTQPSNVGDVCALPIAATLEANCATATPNTIDYAVATADLSAVTCAAAGSNGAWYEITTTDSGAIRVLTTGDVTGMVVYTDCGSELYCNGALVPEFSLTGFLPNTAYLIAIWKEAATTGTSTVCFEDITCNFILDFTATNITETTAEIGWTENGSATAWDIEYGITGFTPTGTPTLNDVGSNPYTVTGLTGTTTYDFYVRADCGMDDTDVSIYNGPYTFTTLAQAPANDNLADAIAINCGDTVLGNTTSATLDEDDAPDAALGADTDSPNVWYSFMGTGDSVLLDTCMAGTDFDTEILVFTGASGALQLISDGYDECGGAGGYAAQTDFISVAGTQYWISIEGYNFGNTGNFELTVTCTPLSTPEFENGLALTYYPNPVNDILSLKAQKDIENVSVYNMLGQEVLRTAPNVVNAEVNMSDLQSGAYFVKVTIGSATETVRIIKN
ncbi:choice-of-anchor J domain-containing protein [Lacinutrix sp. MEBiC02404]